MAFPILILGESGTGKSTSLRNFGADEIALVNIAGKPLPFKKKFETLKNVTDSRKINKFIDEEVERGKKIIVIDDGQYIMGLQFMRRVTESGWDKFNELQADFFNVLDHVLDLPDDVLVYFLCHIQTMDDGRQKIKTIGKMLDEKITVEGLFTTVLKTHVSDGKYYFLTQNSGKDTVKSPMGMFPSFAIDNDLKYVDDKIRNYYEIGNFKSDEEMKSEDEKVANTELENSKGRVKRSKRTSEESQQTSEESSEAVKPSKSTSEPIKERRSRKHKEPTIDDLVDEEPEISDEDLPFTVEKSKKSEKSEKSEKSDEPVRRTRRRRE